MDGCLDDEDWDVVMDMKIDLQERGEMVRAV
jgi:hypothetical protein